MRTKLIILACALAMQANDLLKWLPYTWNYPIKGYREDGGRYDITLPIEAVYWFWVMFGIITVLVAYIHILEKKLNNYNGLLPVVYLFAFWTFEQLLSWSKPWYYIKTGFSLIPQIPVSADAVLVVGISVSVCVDFYKNGRL